MYERTHKQITAEAEKVKGEVCRNKDHEHAMAKMESCIIIIPDKHEN